MYSLWAMAPKHFSNGGNKWNLKFLKLFNQLSGNCLVIKWRYGSNISFYIYNIYIYIYIGKNRNLLVKQKWHIFKTCIYIYIYMEYV